MIIFSIFLSKLLNGSVYRAWVNYLILTVNDRVIRKYIWLIKETLGRIWCLCYGVEYMLCKIASIYQMENTGATGLTCPYYGWTDSEKEIQLGI